VTEENLACVIFMSMGNVVFTNALVLGLEEKMASASFPSWCSSLVFSH
jgi:hypothetical protein